MLKKDYSLILNDLLNQTNGEVKCYSPLLASKSLEPKKRVWVPCAFVDEAENGGREAVCACCISLHTFIGVFAVSLVFIKMCKD